jgi:hypothetical protein
MAETHHRGLGFFYWAGVGFLIVFGVLAILSIGAPFFVVGLVLLGVLLGRGPRWPASLGLFAGAGGVCLVIAAINSIAGAAIWAAVGLGLVGLSSVAYWSLRCRPTAH